MIDRSTDGETAVPEADNGQSGPAFVALANLNHVCPICSNHYERADYLKRHLASHENARQYGFSSSTKSSRTEAGQSGSEFGGAPVPPLPVTSGQGQGDRGTATVPSRHTGHDDLQKSPQPADVAEDTSHEAFTSMLESQDEMHVDATDGMYTAEMGWDFFNSPIDTFNFENNLDFHFDENFGNLNFEMVLPNQSDQMPMVELVSEANHRPNLMEAGSKGLQLTGPHTMIDASGYEAFQRSPWLWTPVRHDHAYAEGSQLSVNEIQMMESPEVNEVRGTDHCVPKMMDSAIRDDIFSLVLKFSSSDVKIRSFPSFRFLNILMQAFFVKQSASVAPWLHSASFEPETAKIELVASIVAAGATLFAVPHIWKMGLALQEIVKLACPAAIDQDNRRVRDLQSIQAFWMWIKIGNWSGFRRKMEIAEGFAHTVPTMLRRAGAFRHNRYMPAIIPTASDSHEELKQKWLKWVEQESFKR
ncbi:hypothetical protein E8E14_011603 [Neopestalotiopsis sp. 37M]|nr:hypothetical protein E8E14_011603 [Neopestalotiopsis sp. 37M]